MSRRFPAPVTTTEVDVCGDSNSAEPSVIAVTQRLFDWFRHGRPRKSPPHGVGKLAHDGKVIMCPSQSGEHGSVVLGHISPDGRLVRPGSDGLNEEPIPAGSQLRIAGDCLHERCAYWADSCQLAAAIVDSSDSDDRLATCPIRQQCRWWLEHGPTACGTCSYVSYSAPGQVS